MTDATKFQNEPSDFENEPTDPCGIIGNVELLYGDELPAGEWMCTSRRPDLSNEDWANLANGLIRIIQYEREEPEKEEVEFELSPEVAGLLDQNGIDESLIIAGLLELDRAEERFYD